MARKEGFFIFCLNDTGSGRTMIETSKMDPRESYSQKAEVTFKTDAYDTYDDFDPNTPLEHEIEGDPLQNHIEWLAKQVFLAGVEYGREHPDTEMFTAF